MAYSELRTDLYGTSFEFFGVFWALFFQILVACGRKTRNSLN